LVVALREIMDTAFYAFLCAIHVGEATAIGNNADAATYATLHSNIVAGLRISLS